MGIKVSPGYLSPIILASSGVAVAATSSLTEVHFAPVKVPGGILGLNGKIIVEVIFKMTGGNANRAMRVRHSTTSGDTSAGSLAVNVSQGASTLSSLLVRHIINTNSASAQFITDPTNAFGAAGSTALIGAINTASDSWININGLVLNAADTLQLIGYSVYVIPGV